jgi:F-type H+-transporting ATPase subunit b
MEGLGIDLRILVGQIFTFLALMYLLKRFAYKPFLLLLESRQKKIEEGIKKSGEAEESLKKIRVLAEEVRQSQEKKSKEIIAAAEVKAREKGKAVLADAEVQKAGIIQNAKIAMEKEAQKMRESRQKEAVDLAFEITKKTLKDTMTKDQDKKVIERLAANIQAR